MAGEINLFSSSYRNFTRRDRSARQNPASLELPINVEESPLIHSFRTRRHPKTPNSSWSHYNTITRARNSQIKKSRNALICLFFSFLCEPLRTCVFLLSFSSRKTRAFCILARFRTSLLPFWICWLNLRLFRLL